MKKRDTSSAPTVVTTESTVERFFLRNAAIGFLDRTYERIPVLTVENYDALGRLTALRFLEWAIHNPEGVVCLPTGSSSKHFIVWLHYYIDNWSKDARALLYEVGMEGERPPRFDGLRLVQMGEFFPILQTNERSCHYHLQKYYIDGFGFNRSRALLFDIGTFPEAGTQKTLKEIERLFPEGKIDLNLRYKSPVDVPGIAQKQVIQYLDNLCENYETAIRKTGGIGFFLDSIGPDGHIAFNPRGSSHLSCTRLSYMNYETMAAAAQDLGGIEVVRKKAVVTIGLATVCFNQDCTAIIFAAGEERSSLIAQSVQQSPHLDYPASALQKLSNARMYLTSGASINLVERRIHTLLKTGRISETEQDRLILDGATSSGRKLSELIQTNYSNEEINRFFAVAAQCSSRSLPELARATGNRIAKRIEQGLHLPENQRFLHTGPHHDDIELAYLPLIHHLVRSPKNVNYFAYLTSGYTSVTNEFILNLLDTLIATIKTGELFNSIEKDDLINPNLKEIEIHGYLNAIARQCPASAALFSSMRIFRHLTAYLHTDSDYRIVSFSEELRQFIREHDPGREVPESVKQIKSWIREWESELVWAHFGLNVENIHHLRQNFYHENVTTHQKPSGVETNNDTTQLLNLFNKIRPTIVTLALDPEGNGPDTHYKSLIVLREAILRYTKLKNRPELRIWGYRNVWSQFHPADATMIVPVSLNSFAVLHNIFNACFLSQRSASFPSTKLDGTFSELAQRTWVQQFTDLATVMGKKYFYDHPHPMMRRTYGIIYIKDMSSDEFFKETE